MRVTLGDEAIAAGTRICFDRPPRWYLPDVPTAIEGILVGVIGIKHGSVAIVGRVPMLFSAAFGVLFPSLSVVASHKTIVTYSPYVSAAR